MVYILSLDIDIKDQMELVMDVTPKEKCNTILFSLWVYSRFVAINLKDFFLFLLIPTN